MRPQGKGELTLKLAYKTRLGKCYASRIEDALDDRYFKRNKGKASLIFTSPPFPLNRKKKYGNRTGSDYIEWLAEIMTRLREYLRDDGSLVVEIGNAWEPNSPVMSTLPLETLLAIKHAAGLNLCQQFVWFNTAKLPSPVQWVNIERSRVKDSFTHIWWLSPSPSPKANNRKILAEYSDSMRRLLKSGAYNSGRRPSEHNIGHESFLKDNGGAIPSNVLVGANTASNSRYLTYCKTAGIELHPARMPRFVPDYFIKFLTEKNDLVIDPFAGSNTTGEACEALSRKWLSVEANSSYVEGSIARFSNAKIEG